MRAADLSTRPDPAFRQAWLLRLALVLVVAATSVVAVHTYDVARVAVAMAPELADYRVPLYLAAGAGVLLVLVGVTVAADLASAVQQGRGDSPQASVLLRRLRLLVWVLAGCLTAGVVTMEVVLSGLDLDMPIVWLFWLVVEGSLVALARALRARQRRIDDVLVGAR